MTEDKKVISKFLFLLIGIVIALLCGAIFLPKCLNKKVNIQDKNITSYDDRFEKAFPGSSQILSLVHDSTGLKLSYILNAGFTYPYAGIQIVLKDSSNFFDCSKFDALNIRISSTQLSDCKLYLKVFDSKISNFNDPLSERYLKKELELNPTPVTFSIPFKQFHTPEWWYQKNNITLKDITPLDLSKVTTLQIESGSTAKTGITDTISVYEIYLSKKPNKYAITVLSSLLIFIITFTWFRLKPQQKNSPIIITYDKKEISSYRDLDTQRISGYVAEHFSMPELTIVTVGKSLGYSQKKISKVMNDVFKMSFKQYLTSIRIHEAKRLLLETDRLVIDIALAVGFNSISNFNRVFKTSTQLSPLEYRNKKT